MNIAPECGLMPGYHVPVQFVAILNKNTGLVAWETFILKTHVFVSILKFLSTSRTVCACAEEIGRPGKPNEMNNNLSLLSE